MNEKEFKEFLIQKLKNFVETDDRDLKLKITKEIGKTFYENFKIPDREFSDRVLDNWEGTMECIDDFNYEGKWGPTEEEIKDFYQDLIENNQDTTVRVGKYWKLSYGD